MFKNFRIVLIFLTILLDFSDSKKKRLIQNETSLKTNITVVWNSGTATEESLLEAIKEGKN